MLILTRQYRITINDRSFDNIDQVGIEAEINIKKTLRRRQNECTFKLYNVNKETIAQIQQADPNNLRIIIEAGKAGEMQQLFAGYVSREGITLKLDKGTDIILMGKALDRGTAPIATRIARNWSANTAYNTIVRDCINILQIASGNLSNFIISCGGRTSCRRPINFSGNVTDLLINIFSASSLNWSVQDGELLIRNLEGKRSGNNIVINDQTGLLGSPAVGRSNRTIVNCLLLPGLLPGAGVFLDAKFTSGDFEIVEAEYKIDTAGHNYDAKLMLRPVRA